MRAIAREIGVHFSTVSRILAGIIRTCLTLAESVATPWRPVLRELFSSRIFFKEVPVERPCGLCSNGFSGLRTGGICPGCGSTDLQPPNPDEFPEHIRREHLAKPWLPLPDPIARQYSATLPSNELQEDWT